MSTELNARRGVINVWRPADLPEVELHRGTSVDRPVPRHWHEEFQLCLIEEGEGDLTYRGARHLTPPASLFIVHPGESHANSSFTRAGCSYRTIFVATGVLRRADAELFGHDRGVPFFPSTMIFDPQVIIPGHGDVLRDQVYLNMVIDLTEQVVAVVRREVGNMPRRTLEEVQQAVAKSVDAAAWRQKFAGDDKDNRDNFEQSFDSLIKVAYKEALVR
jgi:hypothetical protein